MPVQLPVGSLCRGEGRRLCRPRQRQWLDTQGSSGQVAVMMTPRGEWDNRRHKLEGSLRSLLQTGRPEAHWLMIWRPEQ